MALQHPTPAGFVTTTILIRNLHCASCLSHIQNALGVLRLVPLSITADYASHELTVIHSPEHLGNELSRALSDAAFEVGELRTENELGRVIYEQHEGRASSEGPPTLSQQTSTISSHQTTPAMLPVYVNNEKLNEKHVEHCLSCQNSGEKDLSKDFVVSISEPQHFTATLSIAGMTCAACILSITEGVQQLDFLEDVSVSLLTNSATVTFAGQKDDISLIIQRI
jgi:Cu+-exporting ATPase